MSTPSRNLFHHLPPPAECLALIVGTLELLPFGIVGLRDPAIFAHGYGLPITTTTTSTKTPSSASSSSLSPSSVDSEQTQKALLSAIAARNIQNGILLLTFGLVLRDRRSLGVVVLAGLVATVADTVIVRSYGVREKVLGHVVGVVNSAVIGGCLLGWGRGDGIW
ncbi:hypothetical protein BDU57DRAFT_459632 [Ampelomyces quisqualis]|uniref:DUF4267 domain-containing protein n=1 Tax=Ampelomyces quisqualis TaxID=50730 RepID=A0A6A5QAU8_AMPQU|nr:hypothetical protein BDU57DRAFT_459632 [Ampelomyces quisqualis]